jgi:hypothetical protein
VVMCLLTRTSSNSASTTAGSSLAGDAGTGSGSACFAFPLKAATAAMTLFCFLGEAAGGAAGWMGWPSLPRSVLARPSIGRAVDEPFDGELSLCLLSLPWVSDSGARSPVFLRENVLSSVAADELLGACIDLGRSFATARFCEKGWSCSKLRGVDGV